MGLITIIGIAFGLAMDAFAVSIAASAALRGLSKRQAFRLSFHFGLFQFMMPVIGWLGGMTVADLVSAFDHWIAFGLLALIGSRMIYGAVKGEDEIESTNDPTRGFTLIMLSIATSIDALAVGLSLAMLEVSIWYPSVIIGVVAAGMTALGASIGSRLGARFGKRMEFIGGAVLIAIGIRILVGHMIA